MSKHRPPVQPAIDHAKSQHSKYGLPYLYKQQPKEEYHQANFIPSSPTPSKSASGRMASNRRVGSDEMLVFGELLIILMPLTWCNT